MIKNTYYYHFVINLRITIIKERSGDMDSGELLKKLRVERGISQKKKFSSQYNNKKYII